MWDILYDGLVFGAKIASAAIPYVLVYKYLRMLNFAFGEMMTFGAYIAYLLVQIQNWPLFPAVIVACLFSAVLGLVIERVAYRPVLSSKDRYLPLVSSVGVSIFLQSFYESIFGSRTLYVNNLSFDEKYLFVVLALELLLVLMLIHKTRLGDQMAGVASNQYLAQLAGINPSMVFSVVFAISSCLAALTGIFELSDNGVAPNMGFHLGLLAFASAILARLESVTWTVIASFIVGISVQFAQATGFLNDRILWVLLVLLALSTTAVSRMIKRYLRIQRGEDMSL